VTAKKDSVNSIPITVQVNTTLTPPPVTGLAAAYNPETQTINVGWTNPVGSTFTGLTLGWSNGADIAGSVELDGTSAHARAITYISNNSGLYTITVRVKNSTVSSAPAVFQVNTAVVPPVTDLGAVYNSDARTITASWTRPYDTSAYTGLILAWDNAAGVSGSVELGRVETYTIGGIANNSGTYTVTVTARNGAARSVSNPSVQASTAVVPPVTGLAAIYNPTAQTITASWTPPADSAYTGLTLAWDNGANVSGSAELGKISSHNIPNITLGTGTYTITVRAKHGSALSPARSVQASTAPVFPVTGLTAIYNPNTKTITASWVNPVGKPYTGLILAWDNGAGVSGSLSLGKVSSRTITGIAVDSGVYTVSVTVKNETVLSAAETAIANSAGAAVYAAPITLIIDDEGEGAFSQGTFTLSKAASQSQTVSVAGTWDNPPGPRWFVDGIQKGTGNSITIEAAQHRIGTHSLSLWVVKNAMPWSKELEFTVTD
jgi:hypothetical protein